MNLEKPEEIKGDFEDLEIREKISDVLELIKKENDCNPEDINEEEITSVLISQFNSFHEDHIAKEGFLATIEQKIKIIIIRKTEERITAGFLNTMEAINKIKKRSRGETDKNLPEISKAA